MRRGSRTSSQAWADYAKQQGESQAVLPLMVLQVPNTPDPKDIGQALATIFKQWPELPSDCVAHVLGEHSAQQFGPYKVPYISPERVQDATWVRVLIAKDAISTGWDCPRAEVMVSFRAAVDRTHITQLLGRMVRTPLARRIPGNEQLNSVHCLLPLFDAKTVSAVADALMKGGSSDDDAQPPTGRVLVNPKTMRPNPAVVDAVWQKFESLPCQTRPQRGACSGSWGGRIPTHTNLGSARGWLHRTGGSRSSGTTGIEPVAITQQQSLARAVGAVDFESGQLRVFHGRHLVDPGCVAGRAETCSSSLQLHV